MIQVSSLVGISLGGIPGYWEFMRLGWDPLVALAATAGAIAFSGVLIWLILRAVWGPQETETA